MRPLGGLLCLLIGCGSPPETEEPPPVDTNADGDCLTDARERELGTNPNLVDSDADTLDDCDEIERGSDPKLADSDGDGLTDPQEVACVSSPIDAREKCYACGWKHNDPKNLVESGKEVGNVIGNVELLDQCLETVHLWDFAATADSPSPEPAQYHILFMTAAW